MPLRRKARNSETERMSRALILFSGTGDQRGAAGVKTVKLYREQDQIGGLLSVARACPRVRSLEVLGNQDPREMTISFA
jgi:hypothetical protein